MEFGTTSKGKCTGKASSFEIIEDADNIYILDYIIPKENNKENFRKREKLIWEMYGRWCVENPDKKCFNQNLQSDITVTSTYMMEYTKKTECSILLRSVNTDAGMAALHTSIYSTEDLSTRKDNNDSTYQYGGRQRLINRMRR